MFTIEVEFLRGVFDAGGKDDETIPEWPPHPARLLNGLIASTETAREIDAIRWFEDQSAPTIDASTEVADCGGRSSYVPTNRREKDTDSYGRFVGRKALGPRTWRAVSPADPLIRYTWDANPPESTSALIDDVVGRLPYLGRSTSPVVARVDLSDERRESSTTWSPVATGEIGTTLQVPGPGYVAELEEAHADGRQPWEVPRRSVDYDVQPPSPRPSAATIASPYGELIVLGFADGRRLGVGHAVTVSSRLREAIESHLDGGPLVLRGLPPKHRRTAAELSLSAPRQQVIIAGLPFVGHDHADGDLRGIGLALPVDIDPEDRRLVLRGLSRVIDNGLTLGRLGLIGLDPSVQRLDTLRPDRWTRSSRGWVTATPISANRHHRRISPAVLEAEVVASCEHLDLPRPEVIRVSTGPLLAGTQTLSARQRLRHGKEKATASFHAAVQFADEVSGPIVLGSMRRYGLGLMLPAGRERNPR